MSVERELLQRILDTDPKFLGGRFIAEIQELLAQPEQTEQEQEPVGYLYKQMDCTGEWATIFKVEKPYITWHDIKDIVTLYTAPPKRKPLTSKLISLGNNCHESFIKGIRFAEKMQGIGGGE